MASNTFGKLFAVTTFGESHGPAIGCVIDGCPPGLEIAPEDFAHDLSRRATGKSRHTSQRREADEVEILSGVYEGRTTGTPIGLLVRNTDARSKDYDAIAARIADAVLVPVGVVGVAAGVIARKWLAERHGVRIRGFVSQIGDRRLESVPERIDALGDVEGNPFFWPDAAQVPALEAAMDALRKSGDSAGARVEVIAEGVPPGWGEPVYGKLDAELAAALMGINAAKGVEIGAGFESVAQPGSVHRDRMDPGGFASNHAGGVLGGISSGQAVRCSVAFKPTSSLRLPVAGLDVDGKVVDIVTTGRHDPCVGIRAVPICEAMVALVLMDQALRHRAQCGDVGAMSPRVPG